MSANNGRLEDSLNHRTPSLSSTYIYGPVYSLVYDPLCGPVYGPVYGPVCGPKWSTVKPSKIIGGTQKELEDDASNKS